MPRKKKAASDVLVLKPFLVKDFIPKFDPFVLDDDDKPIPVKLKKGDTYLPASGVPVDAAALIQYFKYLVDEIGPVENWPDLLAAGKGDLDAAINAAIKDAIPLAEHQAELKKRILITTSDRKIADAVKDALADATPNDEVDGKIDTAVQKATKDMLTKDAAASMVDDALTGMVSQDELDAAVEVETKKMAKMVTKKEAAQTRDAAVAAALDTIDPANLDLDVATAAILEQTGLDIAAMVASAPKKNASSRKKKATTKTAPKPDSQAVAPAATPKKTRSITDFLNEKR